MEYVKKLEVTLASWYRQLPFHLPVGGRKWLTENVWWLVIIGVVLSILSVLATVRTYLWVLELNSGITGNMYYVRPADTTSFTTYLWISMIFAIPAIVLEIMAISPLKAQLKRGWNVIFIAMLLGLLGSIVTALITLNIASLIGAVVGFAIGAFFLFEIHENYLVKQPISKVEAPTVIPPKTT